MKEKLNLCNYLEIKYFINVCSVVDNKDSNEIMKFINIQLSQTQDILLKFPENKPQLSF